MSHFTMVTGVMRDLNTCWISHLHEGGAARERENAGEQKGRIARKLCKSIAALIKELVLVTRYPFARCWWCGEVRSDCTILDELT